MAQPAPAPKITPNATVELTYHRDTDTWTVKGNSFPIPRSGIVQFDLDPENENLPTCYIHCTASSAPPKSSWDMPTGGGFTVPVGSGPEGGKS
jgi:hypothetical protein